MNTSKLNVTNSLIVAGLVAGSMLMPVVAASLAETPATHQDASVVSQPTQAEAPR